MEALQTAVTPEKKKKRYSLQAVLTVTLSTAVVLGFSLAGILLPDREISEEERRRLAQAPELRWETIASGRFMQETDTYGQDQFPLRSEFRKLHGMLRRDILRQKDNHGVYVQDGYAAKMDYPLDTKSVDYAASRFSYVYQRFLEGTGSAVYVSVIPDKNQFLSMSEGRPCLDFETMVKCLTGQMEYASYIDLRPALDLEAYYRTDIHWRQERLIDAAEILAKGMGAVCGQTEYRMQVRPEPFYGVYQGQAALSLPPDSLAYLEADFMEECRVWDYETQKELPVYSVEEAEGMDPYSFFLSGSKSLLRLENPAAPEDKRLILFRDSFGSSIAPLLAEGYREIFLVDIRYINPAALESLVPFEGQDVLFLYSEAVLNSSETIR